MKYLNNHYDGWAIATSPDGLAAYYPLPASVRIMAWVKPNAIPGAHKLRSNWEPVIVNPPAGRRSNRDGRGMISDVLIANAPRTGFRGAKPEKWTVWVLQALGFDYWTDEVHDWFPGSGSVQHAIDNWRMV